MNGIDETVEQGSDRFFWGFMLGSSAGAAAWIMFDLWWLVGAGILAGIAVTSWFDHSDH